MRVRQVELPSRWHRMKIVGTVTPDAKRVWGNLTDRYDLHGAYEKAHERKDPYLAPHGLFRKLRFGDNHHAKEFLETFGPLKMTVGERLYGRGAHISIDLREFWSLQLRFSPHRNSLGMPR
jgi:hypothetical protein